MTQPKIMAVAGPSGSRKTESCRKIQAAHPDAVELVSLDDLYRDQEKFPRVNGWINWELPRCINFSQLNRILRGLKQNQAVECPTIDHKTGRRGNRIVEPKPLILVEGFLMLYWKSTRGLCDSSVFLEVAPALQFEQRRQKDPDCDPEYIRRVVIPYFQIYGAQGYNYAEWIIRGDQTAREIARSIVHAIHQKFGNFIDYARHKHDEAGTHTPA